jgi:PAS domain S-box-containing protein
VTLATPLDPLSSAGAREDMVFAERVRLLYARNAVVLSALVACAALFTAVSTRPFSREALAWVGAVAGTSFLRLLATRRYGSRPRPPREALRWARLYAAGSALSGAAFGLAGALFYVPGALPGQTFLVFLLGGVAGGAAATNFTYFPAVAAFAVPAVAPLLVRLFSEGDRVHAAMGAIVLLFGVVMSTVSRTAARAVRDSVRLRFHNEALAEKWRREVAEHRGTIDALRESESLFRDLAERAVVGVYLIQDGVFQYVNPKMAEIFGYAPAEMMGKVRNLDVTHPDDRTAVIENVRKRLSSEVVSIQYEFRGLTRTGEVIEIEVFGTRTSYHGCPAIVGTLLDITRRKKAEQEQLRAEKLESLGILAGGLAHDFNNLLAAILGNLSVARESDRGEAQLRDVLADAEGAALRARDLARQLLTFSRGGEPVKTCVDIGPLLRSSTSFAVRGSPVLCEHDIPRDLWPLDVDEGQIGQVVHNLALNAVQAMPEGGRLRVTAENVPRGAALPAGLAPGPYVRIDAADTGPGIGPDVARRIFDPYFTTKPSGTGLGLATAHSIVRRHGGYIGLDSQPGRGATFHVYLPAALSARASPPAPPGALVRGQGNIIVMDDDEAVQRVTARMLTRLGFSVLCARDGSEVLALCASAREQGQPIDAAIMDLTIPGGMGGKETVKLLREREPDVKAIVSSGYSSDPVMAEYASHGFAGVVAKPYRIEELNEVLRRVLGARGENPGGATPGSESQAES